MLTYQVGTVLVP